MPDLLRLDPPPRTDDIAIWTRNGDWHRIKPSDYMAKLSVLEANLPYVTREIPIYVTTTTTSGGVPTMPDESATNIVIVWIRVPTTWDGTTDITLKTLWVATSTGLKDIETEVGYFVETDETAMTTVSVFTNTNLTWTVGTTSKVLTTTIVPAAGRYYRVRFRCNTGDANTGDLFMDGAYATTKVR